MNQIPARARFQGWVERFGSELHHVCIRRAGGRPALGEELLHETYLVAWSKIDLFEGDDESARRWLHRIAFNLAPKVWRKNPAAYELTPEALHHHRASTWEDIAPLERQEEAGQMRQCFEGLEALDQRILQMRFGLMPDPEAPDLAAELSWAEIAHMLSRSLGAAFAPDQSRMRASRALTRLRRCIEGLRGNEEML